VFVLTPTRPPRTRTIQIAIDTLYVSALVTRLTCAVLFVALATIAAYSFARKDARFAVRVLWVAAIILAIAIRPERLFFLTGSVESLHFFRNAFAIVGGVLLVADLFVVIWIQLPRERIPRFSGIVVERNVTERAEAVEPTVQFHDAQGELQTFTDNLAAIRFPRRKFEVGDGVTVAAPPHQRAYIDYTFFSRWDMALFMVCCTALAFAFSVSCQLKYLAASKVAFAS
jgi:hypothetical protein